MDEVELAILSAWKRIEPKLLANPTELSTRLRRKQSETFSHIPRAWCLAVRANDTRIPDHACDIKPSSRARHQVVHHRPLLFELCSPIRIEFPGETIRQVAAKLGVKRTSLLWPRVNGVFQTHYLPGSRRRPLLYSDRLLDPAARNFVSPDPIWSWTATYLVQRIPADFAQKLVRLPCYYDRNSQYNDSDDNDDVMPDRAILHPRGTWIKGRYSRRLPPPPPDYVWYKWKGDKYLGYDWRNPHAKAGYERSLRRAQVARDSRQRRRKPRTHSNAGSLSFRGWRFLCPLCDRAVKILYCPQPPISLITLPLPASAPASPTPPHHHPSTPPPVSFACRDCLKLDDCTRMHRGSWNRVVAYLSNFLLYGHEVPRPTWFTPPRPTKRYGPSTPTIALHRQQILHGLLQNWSYSRIAQEYGFTPAYVTRHAHYIYEQHDVKGGRKALAAKLGHKLPDRTSPAITSSTKTRAG